MRKQDVSKCLENLLEKYWNDPSKVSLPADPDFIYKGIRNVKINEDSLIEEEDSIWSFNGTAQVTTTDCRHTVTVSDITYNVTGRASITGYPNKAPIYSGVEVVSVLPEVNKLIINTLSKHVK